MAVSAYIVSMTEKEKVEAVADIVDEARRDGYKLWQIYGVLKEAGLKATYKTFQFYLFKSKLNI